MRAAVATLVKRSAEAEKYWTDNGFSREAYAESLQKDAINEAVYEYVTKDVAITDEDIEKASDTVETPGEMGGGLMGLGEEGPAAGAPQGVGDAASEWNEGDHPRDKGGKFTSGGGENDLNSLAEDVNIKLSNAKRYPGLTKKLKDETIQETDIE